MAASDSTIPSDPTGDAAEPAKDSFEAVLERTRKDYWNAKLWLHVLDQDSYWVPAGAWQRYCRASMPSRIVEANGEPVRITQLLPTFESDGKLIEGVVAVTDMEISWRQRVANFMWRKSLRICAGLSHGIWHTAGYGSDCSFSDREESPYFEYLRMVDKRFAVDREDPWNVWGRRSRYAGMTVEQARRTWFEERPLIVRLRASVIEERDTKHTGPVILGETTPTERRQLIVTGATAKHAGARLTATGGTDEDLLASLVEGARPEKTTDNTLIVPEPAPERFETREINPLKNDLDDVNLAFAMGWAHRTRADGYGEFRKDNFEVVTARSHSWLTTEDLLRWLDRNAGAVTIGSTARDGVTVTCGTITRSGTLARAVRDVVETTIREQWIAANPTIHEDDLDDDGLDDDMYDQCFSCGEYHAISYACHED